MTTRVLADESVDVVISNGVINLSPDERSKSFMRAWAPGLPITDYLVSATIKATKPSP